MNSIHKLVYQASTISKLQKDTHQNRIRKYKLLVYITESINQSLKGNNTEQDCYTRESLAI